MTIRTAWRLLLVFAVLLVLIVGWSLTHRHPRELTVTFLDVGQGDAAVIESPSGKVMVVDTGPNFEDGSDDMGRRVVLPYLLSRGINHIDVLLLTHPHSDHIGGAMTLLDRFPVGMLIDNGQAASEPLVKQIQTSAQAHRVTYKPAYRGETLDFGDGTAAQVLSPTQAEREGAPNDASIVLRLQYGRTSFLFTGDAEAGEESDLISARLPLDCDVLKVGHHGSHTSSTSEFLKAVHPHYAVMSLGKRNLFGHPSKEVLDRLNGEGVQTFRTDQNGAVTCTSDGVSVHLRSMNQPH